MQVYSSHAMVESPQSGLTLFCLDIDLTALVRAEGGLVIADEVQAGRALVCRELQAFDQFAETGCHAGAVGPELQVGGVVESWNGGRDDWAFEGSGDGVAVQNDRVGTHGRSPNASYPTNATNTSNTSNTSNYFNS